MGSKKHRIHNTDTENLISNLRGEVGETIYSWILLRNLMVQANGIRTSNLEKDLENTQLRFLNSLIDKIEDEIIARLSELAERKIGRLNFYFAQVKLNLYKNEVGVYKRFIEKNRFDEKRNYDISHKELPEKWTEHKFINIEYSSLVKAIVLALRLMKLFDGAILGPSSKYLWKEARRRRYTPLYPARASYLLLPYLFPSEEDRINIIKEEMREGRNPWEDVATTVNGVKTTIKVSKRWGAIIVGRQLVMLDNSVVDINDINIGPVEIEQGSV